MLLSTKRWKSENIISPLVASPDYLKRLIELKTGQTRLFSRFFDYKRNLQAVKLMNEKSKLI